MSIKTVGDLRKALDAFSDKDPLGLSISNHSSYMEDYEIDLAIVGHERSRLVMIHDFTWPHQGDGWKPEVIK